MKHLKLYEAADSNQKDLELQKEQENQAKINMNIQKLKDTIAKNNAIKGKSESVKMVENGRTWANVAKLQASLAQSMQKEAQLMIAIGQLKTKE